MTLRTLIDDAQAWWSLKTKGERLLFTGLGFIFVLTAWWSLIWSPVQKMRSSAIQSLERSATAQVTLASIPEALSRSRLGTIDPESARATITSSAAAAGIVIKKIEADGGDVRLSLDPLAFDALMIWLQTLSASEGIGVASARIERRPEPGVVSAELVLSAQ